MEKIIPIASVAEMDQLAKKIARHLDKGSIIGLAGDLGSGKTTFTKFLARYLGVTDTVNSPTFTLLKIYQGNIPFYHIDVYRLDKGKGDPSLDDYLFGEGICVIEWYPIIQAQLPDEMLTIDIAIKDSTNRTLTIKGSGRYEKIVEMLGN